VSAKFRNFLKLGTLIMLFPRLCEFETLRVAWQRVLSHYPASQVPLALQEFDRKKDALLNRLSHTLRNVTFVTTAASLSVDLMSECAERGIGIQVLGHAGRPVVVAGSPEMPAHELSLRQSALAEQPAGLKLARTLISGKIENQMRLLRYFGKYRGRTGAEFGKQAVGAVELMTRIVAELKLITYPESASPEQIDLYRGRLFALEGRAAGHYWNAVRSLVAGHEIFEGRVRKGARDKVNSLLNYGYGILYSRLMPLLLRAGLNPYVGFLHKPQPGKAGLLFDAIEEFRAPVVDRVVFSLLNRKVALPMGVEGLDVASRAVLARAVLRRLQTQTRYHGAQFPMQKIMEMQVKKLVEAIHGELEYEPFAMPW
jgi:CRISPR-associated protein Cas1